MRLFGTNGVRGASNKDMSPDLALKLGKAIGSWLRKGDRVAIAKDPRTSGDMIESAVISGLLSTGVDVIDIGMLPTPALQFYVKNRDVDAGIMITASHNPPEFNGIKVVAGDGTELPRNEEEKIELRYFNDDFRAVEWGDIGELRKDYTARDLYIEGIVSKVDKEAIKSRKFTVVLDCANGASSVTSPYILKKLGCRVISLNAQPDGHFPGHESEPSPDNLKDLVSAVVESGADVGIAHDGDADRVIFIDEKGNYIQGDVSLAIMVKYSIKNEGDLVVTPVSTSKALEDVVNSLGGKVVYTRVGAPIVARKMLEIGAIFGGEENGGLIFGEHQYCRDGAMGAAKMLEIMAKTGKKLSEIVSEIPRYALYKNKIRCPEHLKEKVMDAVAEEFSSYDVDRTDGVKVWMEDGWLLIRPSGTEPIFRIYAESESREKAEKLGKIGYETIKNIVEGFE